MKTSLFSFDLPEELIAHRPPELRGTCRLMLLDRTGKAPLLHRKMSDFVEFVSPGTLMVFNETRVRKARLYAKNRQTEAKAEFLFLNTRKDGIWKALVSKGKKRRITQRWIFDGGVEGEILECGYASGVYMVKLEPQPDEEWFETWGHVPLPPYMKRDDDNLDAERYQTVYARQTGSVAAPTAGLHFTRVMLDNLAAKGVDIAQINLHVGLGTFLPVRSEDVEGHLMHSEAYSIPDTTIQMLESAKKEGRPVLAVGTTTVRTLESAWNGSQFDASEGKTDLFIYPGYEFSVVDEIFTNFHTPKSSLIMMISAFCGRKRLLKAYKTAVDYGYRFYSYGDAMLIRR